MLIFIPTQNGMDMDTQTHEDTDAQTHRHTDRQTHGLTNSRPPPRQYEYIVQHIKR